MEAANLGFSGGHFCSFFSHPLTRAREQQRLALAGCCVWVKWRKEQEGNIETKKNYRSPRKTNRRLLLLSGSS